MPSYAEILLLALPCLAAAAPTQKLTQKNLHSVPRVSTGIKTKAQVAHYKTYLKFHSPAPAAVIKAAKAVSAADDTGSVAASPQPYDSEYLCPVTVGNNQLNLDFDTGSSDLWVFSSETPNAGSHSTYDTSSGQQESGETWSIVYGDHSGASGNVFADTVTVGGATVTNQAVEAATSVSSQFVDGPSDGLLGLGYDSGNTCQPNQCQTFFGNLMNSVPSPVFTADLQPNGGSYDFGYIDSSKYSGSITYVPTLQENPSYWDFTAGDNIGYSIMDTGTSLWYLPDSTVQNYYGQISDANYNQNDALWVFNCNDNLPDMSVDIGGTTFTVPGSELNFQPLGDGSGNCVGGIQQNDGLPGSIFGDVFMKNFFVVFDLGNNQIGIANQ